MRNRARIIEAASDAFRELGLDASVAEIARRAGVGSGTLFRNFPSKEDLVYAVIETRMKEWTLAAQSALAEDDAETAFIGFVFAAADAQYRDRGLFDAYKEGLIDQPELFECKGEAMELSGKVLKRAQDVGAVRRDISTEDLGNLTAAAVGAGERNETAAEDDGPPYQRYLEILLAGLRPQT